MGEEVPEVESRAGREEDEQQPRREATTISREATRRLEASLSLEFRQAL